MWSFVAKKQAHCDPADPADDHKGDWWDHVAYDAEHRLVLAVVPGARSIEDAEGVTRETDDRTAGRTDGNRDGSPATRPPMPSITTGIRMRW